MPAFLIDTDVLIDHLRGLSEAQDYLRERIDAGDELYCSVITRAELFSGLRRGEEGPVRSLLNRFQEVPVDRAVAEGAGEYRRRFAESHGLLLPDALIAASAKAVGAALVTLNTKHFPMVDISVISPYSK